MNEGKKASDSIKKLGLSMKKVNESINKNRDEQLEEIHQMFSRIKRDNNNKLSDRVVYYPNVSTGRQCVKCKKIKSVSSFRFLDLECDKCREEKTKHKIKIVENFLNGFPDNSYDKKSELMMDNISHLPKKYPPKQIPHQEIGMSIYKWGDEREMIEDGKYIYQKRLSMKEESERLKNKIKNSFIIDEHWLENSNLYSIIPDFNEIYRRKKEIYPININSLKKVKGFDFNKCLEENMKTNFDDVYFEKSVFSIPDSIFLDNKFDYTFSQKETDNHYFLGNDIFIYRCLSNKRGYSSHLVFETRSVLDKMKKNKYIIYKIPRRR